MSTELSETILESMPLGLVVVDTQLTVLRYNETAAQIMGKSVEDVVGENIDEVFRPRPEDRLIQVTVEKRIEFTDMEVQMQMQGYTVWVMINTRLMHDELGEVIGATMVFSDITSTKEMEAQLVRSARLVTIGEMAAGAAHEIRNPLTVIKGFLQLWALEREHPFLSLVMGEIEQIDTIVQQFLQLSKKEAGPDAGQQPFDLRDSIANIGMLCHSEAILRGVELTVEQAAGPLSVQMNRTEWKQIVVNLIRNAFEAFPAEQGDKRIAVHVRKRRHHAAVFIVDNGAGMSPSVLRQVRAAFYTTKEAGTGLGLSICEHLAERNSCRFQLYSREGKGTTVVLQVPLREEPSAAGESIQQHLITST